MTDLRDRVPVSVLIPAKNEELNLAACLNSVAPAAEIFVVDSYSSDRTVEIAKEHGAIVYQFDFQGEKERHEAALAAGKPSKLRKKKNWSLDELPFSNEWILIVDCDERITPALWEEMAALIKQDECNGYYLNRRVYFLGKWIRHGGKYPDWNLRFFKHKQGRYENLNLDYIPNSGDNEVHEHVILQGKVGYLKNDMDHIDFRDIYQWLARHNRYSNWEAGFYNQLLNGKLNDGIQPNPFKTGPERTRFLRMVWARLWFKPLLRFLIFYVLRLGFLDGQPGYIYARLLSQYEYQIWVKFYELRKFSGHLNTDPVLKSKTP